MSLECRADNHRTCGGYTWLHELHDIGPCTCACHIDTQWARQAANTAWEAEQALFQMEVPD